MEEVDEEQVHEFVFVVSETVVPDCSYSRIINSVFRRHYFQLVIGYWIVLGYIIVYRNFRSGPERKTKICLLKNNNSVFNNNVINIFRIIHKVFCLQDN